MQTQYTVTIRKEHCIGKSYFDHYGCPLYTAIKEQLPEFEINMVLGYELMDIHDRMWGFDSNYFTGWNSHRQYQLEVNKILEHKVTFVLKEQEQIIPESSFKEITFVKIKENITLLSSN